MKRLALVLLITAAPSTRRTDALLTGDTTATTAADAARKAEKENDTGLIAASSNDPSGNTQPEPTSQPAAVAPVLEVRFVNGTATMSGEPISDFAKVAADAVAADPGVALSIVSSEEIDPARLLEITNAAKQAGIGRVSVKIVVDGQAPNKPADESKPSP